MLTDHKIAQIKTKRLRTRYPRLYGRNARLPEHHYGVEFIIQEIITDQGAAGWGMHRTRFPGGLRLTTGVTIPPTEHLIGKRIADLFDPAVGVIAAEALSLDFALHDLAGNILNKPVYALLGAAGSRDVPCYDGAIYMNDISAGDPRHNIDVILDDCSYDYALGYRAFKIKIGRGNKWMGLEDGIRRDIEVTRSIKERFPDCTLLVDANDGYNIDTFLTYLDSVADCDLFWIEEPFRENREDLLRLKQYLSKHSPSTLVADGEAAPDIEQLFDLAEEKLVDVLLMDIDTYGFTEWRSLMPRVAAADVRVSPHNWGLKVKTHYTAHFAVSHPSVLTIEGVPDETEGVDFAAFALRHGKLHVPDLPGFGMQLIWAPEIK